MVSIGEIPVRVVGEVGDGGGFGCGGGVGPVEGGSMVTVVVAAGIGAGGAARLGEWHVLDPNSIVTNSWWIFSTIQRGIWMGEAKN